MTNTVNRRFLIHFGKALENAQIYNYAIFGGAACVGLGSLRNPVNIDIVVNCNKNESLQDIMKRFYNNNLEHMTYHAAYNDNGNDNDSDTTLIRFMGVPINMIDPGKWLHMPQYQQFLEPQYQLYQKLPGIVIKLVEPSILIQEKFRTLNLRRQQVNQVKIDTDVLDISFLLTLCKHSFHVNDRQTWLGIQKYIQVEPDHAQEVANLIIKKSIA